MSDLTDAIRARLDSTHNAAPEALIAVLAVCEQTRPMLVGPDNEPVGRAIAAEFEQTIARALGITVHTWCGNCEGVDPRSCINA